MKIWLDENYNILRDEERNFGRGNNKYDFVQVYIPSISIERDNTLPTFLFETPVQKKYGPFVHDTPTWFDGIYTVFKIILNDAILSENGELTITIAINFYNEENKIVKIRRVTAKGFVLDNIVINGEVVIIGNETTILESLNQKVDAYDKRLFETNNNLNILESKTLRFGRYLGEFNSRDEMYQGVLDLFNYDEEDTSSAASATLDSYTYIFYNIQGIPDSFMVFDLKEKNFYVITYENNTFIVKKNFVTKDEFDRYKSAGKDFFQIDSVSKLKNLPKEAVEEHPGIWASIGGAGDILFLKTQFSGMSKNTYYIALHLYKGVNIKNAFNVDIYEAIFDDGKNVYDIDFERSLRVPEIFVNPDNESDNKDYISTLRLDDKDYDLDYRKYSNDKILQSENQLKEYVSQNYPTNQEIIENYYNKEEVQEMHAALSGLHFQIVEKLPNIIDRPDPKIIYLVPSNEAVPGDSYDEWVIVNNRWEFLGSTRIDLSNYLQIELHSSDGRSVVNHTGDRIEIEVEGDSVLAKTIYSKSNLVTSLAIDGREVRIEFIEGQLFLTAPEGGMISLQSSAINLISRDGDLNSNLFLAGDEAKLNNSDIINLEKLNEKLTKKQDTLVSGQNIKTVNGQSLIGQGNLIIDIDGGVTAEEVNQIVNSKVSTEISTEVTNRNNAISSAVKTEKEARESSDNSLSQRIDNVIGNGSVKTIEGACKYADSLISRLINNSPEALDTLYELSQALGNDPNFSTTITNLIATKYNEAVGKIPTKVSQLTNDKGFITGITKTMVITALGYTPPTQDTNTTYSAGTGLNLSGTQFSIKYGTTAGTACQGNDSRLSDSRPASDVYSWAKAASKPSYSYQEITGDPIQNCHLIKMTGNISGIGSFEVHINVSAGQSSKFTHDTFRATFAGKELAATGYLEYGNRYNPIDKVYVISAGSLMVIYAINLSGSTSHLSYNINPSSFVDNVITN